MTVSKHVIIHGRVQGVSYRAWTKKQADALSLSGWVRNRNDGTVEAVFHGEESHVNDMLKRCEKGPIMAKVSGINLQPNEVQAPTSDFKIKETI